MSLCHTSLTLSNPCVLSAQKGTHMFVLSEIARKRYVTKDHVPTQDLHNFFTPDRNLSAEPITEVASKSPVVVESQALPLDWLLGPKDATLTQVERARRASSTDFLATRVLARLQQAEAHEVNLHLKADYRQAWITLSFAQRDIPDAFVQASYAIYGKHPDKVWPATVADRKARLGAEYHDWYSSDDLLRPDVPKIPPTTTADSLHRDAATGAALSTGTVDGPAPLERKTV